nr:hypothetical protein [Tanacetum cinerariifolium]
MAPKKRTKRASPATTTTTTTTPVTNAQLTALIDQGVVDDWQHVTLAKVKGTDVVSYNQRFQELTLMCARMFPEESDKIKRYVGGLPDMIHESVMASKPKTMQDAVEFATEPMDKKIRTFVERQTENKRKQDDNQQRKKRQNTGRAYTTGLREKKPYGGSKPLCSKCNYHHDGSCAPKCHKCDRVGHMSCDCRSSVATNNHRNLTYYECENQGHYRSDCPKLKNQNHENQAGGTEARGMAHALGEGETNKDLNNMKDDINA